jgi:N-acetylglutamate synthase-like GNAT family acetyltransferase
MERHMIDSQPRVRVASGADISALQELISQSYLFLCRRYYTPKQIECALAHHVDIDKQMIDDRTYYVAEIDGEIVGCGGWSKRKKSFGGDRVKSPGDTDLLNPAHDRAPIRGVFVHPSWARRGIKRRIVKCCERAARQANFRNLELSRRRWTSLYIPRADSRQLSLSNTASPMESLSQRFACSRAWIRKLIVGSCGSDPRTETGGW